MQPEDFLEAFAFAVPWFLLAGLFFAIAAWKKRKGGGLHAEARQLLAEGKDIEAHPVLLEALQSANEEPRIERGILADLGGVYQRAGIAFRADDYELLILQFEQLSKKGSHKAWSELKQVQALKFELIERMPKVA